MSRVANRTNLSNNSLRFPLRSLPAKPNLAYLRKSTEGADRQSKSHEQQLEEIRKQVDIADDLVWRDSKSGTNFESREGFQDLYLFCQRHPQPKKAPGCLWMFDESRFGRPLDEDGEVDADTWFEWELKFKKLGWLLRFVETPHTGNAVADDMVTTMKAHMSSQFSRDLSRKVKRGRNNWLRQGYWVGKPPWPAARYDRARDRLLQGVERDATGEIVRSAEPSVNGCELRGIPELVDHWTWAANEVVAGHSLNTVSHRLNLRGVATAQGHRWHRKALVEVLTNRALIGEIVFTNEDGQRESVKARWEPIVERELFDSVQRRIAQMAKKEKRSKSVGNPYVLDNVYCAYCGAKYFGSPVCDKDGRPKTDPVTGAPLLCYRHPSVRASNLGTHDVYLRARENGCKQWSIPAAMAEEAARGLLDNLRGSPDWANEVAEMFQSQREYKSSARFALRHAETELERLNDELANLLSTAKLLKAGSAGQQKMAAEIEEISDKIVAAEADVATAQEQVSSANVAFGYVKEIIDETRQMAAAWSNSDDVAAKRRIVERWISSIWVVVDQQPGERFARSRALHFFLRSSPNDPRIVDLPNLWGKKNWQALNSLEDARQEVVAGGKEDFHCSVERTSENLLPALAGKPALHVRTLLPEAKAAQGFASSLPPRLLDVCHVRVGVVT